MIDTTETDSCYSSIFSFIEKCGYSITETEKKLCLSLWCGEITKDEYLKLIFKENMSKLWQKASV